MDRMPVSETILQQIDPTIGTTTVTTFQRGPALLLCWLGRHDVRADSFETTGRQRIEYNCLRCGRLLTVVNNEWVEDAGNANGELEA
jgi:hypothetical protein